MIAGRPRWYNESFGMRTVSGIFWAMALLLMAASGHLAQDAGTAISLKYRFENPRFYVSVIEIELDGSGAGQLRFKRGESEEMLDRKLKLMPRTLSRMMELIERLGFLNSSEDYQSKKDFSHLGWITISVQRGDRGRTARFNYTGNPLMAELSEIFRAVATQEMDLFDLELAQQHQPLDTPRLLELIEGDLKLERVAEPERLLPALWDIANDDTMPLIARNRARSIASRIEKGKFKTPLRSGK
jgi:hypothetical protein